MEETFENTQFVPMKKSQFDGRRWLAIVAVVLGVILVGGAAAFFFVGRGGGGAGDTVSLTPTVGISSPTSTPTPEPTPSVLKSEVSIKVLNGTGIKGEAAKLVAILKEGGYTKVEAGNASSSNYETTEVSFKSDFPGSYKQEILDKLNATYKSVKQTNEDTGKVDVVIIIGLRPGQTLPEEVSPTPTKAASSPTPTKAASSPTPTGGVTGTPSPTSTLTPTPTL